MRDALSVASECAPLAKTGGLADVVGALPGALAEAGWRVRTLLPLYPAIAARIGEGEEVARWDDLFGGPARLLAAEAAELDLLCLDAPHFFERSGNIYLGPDGRDWPDYAERFAALAWAGAEIATGRLEGWVPEVVHAHDWQGALVPTYVGQMGGGTPTLLTIHNIAFQGIAGPERLPALRLDPARYNPNGFEFWGRINMLKAGLRDAAAISTVSPTYAEELLTPAFGMGLEGVLATRAGDLHGILNGIDTRAWDPARDVEITRYERPAGKKPNRAALIDEFGLDPTARGPLVVVVSRLTGQKGLDLLLQALPALIEADGQLALLGSGEPWLEDGFRQMGGHPRIGVRIGYDEALSHRMFAGGDAIAIPSRFEPCGLTQLYALRYGTVPIVARTGGLADTVIDANAAALRAGVATGLHVEPGNADALAAGLAKAAALHAEPRLWSRLQANGMKQAVGWDASAAQYAALYAELAG